MSIIRPPNGIEEFDQLSGRTFAYYREQAGKRMLLCQPYPPIEFASLIEAAEEFNLDIKVHSGGWYGHGTVCIQLTPKGE
jgi:hypothetical protein